MKIIKNTKKREFYSKDGVNFLLRKWEENESNRLKRLEKQFDSLKFEYELLRSEFRTLQKKVAEKEVTHVQKVQVEIKKPYDVDWDIGY